MIEVMLFVKDFELGSKLSSACVDLDRQIEFTDENSDPDTFSDFAKMVIVDLDEKVFSSVGLVSELKRKGLKVIGCMGSCLLYTSPSPRDGFTSRMPSSA